MLIIFIFSSYQGNLRIFVFEKQLKNNSQTYSVRLEMMFTICSNMMTRGKRLEVLKIS